MASCFSQWKCVDIFIGRDEWFLIENRITMARYAIFHGDAVLRFRILQRLYHERTL